MSELSMNPETERQVDRSKLQVSDEVMIQVTGMNKWYSSFHVLKDIDLTVMAGSLGQLVDLLQNHHIGIIVGNRGTNTRRIVAPIDTTNTFVNIVSEYSDKHC